MPTVKISVKDGGEVTVNVRAFIKGEPGVDGIGLPIQSIANYSALRNLTNYHHNVVIVQDFTYTYKGKSYKTLGGVFKWTGNPSLEDGGTFIAGWERDWDKVTSRPEWWQLGGYDLNGELPNPLYHNGFTPEFASNTGGLGGIQGETNRINCAAGILSRNGLKGGKVELQGGKLYELHTAVVLPDAGNGSNITFDGNFATLKRQDALRTTLTAPLNIGDNTMQVADASIFRLRHVINVVDDVGYSDGANINGFEITAISGNTITFTGPVTTAKSIGADVFFGFGMLGAIPANDLNIVIQNTIFDGNWSNNPYTESWVQNSCMNISGAGRSKWLIDNCQFYNHPSEVIIFGSQFTGRKLIFDNIGGACFHGSIQNNNGPDEKNEINVITDVVATNICKSDPLKNAHSVQFGFYAQSVGTGQIMMDNIQINNNVNGGLLSGLYAVDTKRSTISNSFFSNMDHIIADGGGGYSDLTISNNTFVNCGIVSWGNNVTGLSDQKRLIISSNIFQNSRFSFFASENVIFTNNIIKNDTTFNYSAKKFHSFYTDANAVIQGGGRNVVITGNTIENQDFNDPKLEKAIFLQNAANQEIDFSNNVIKGFKISFRSEFPSWGVNSFIKSKFDNNLFYIPSGATEGVTLMPNWKVTGNKFYSDADGVIYTVSLYGDVVATLEPRIVFDNNLVQGSSNWLAVATFGFGVQISNNTIDGIVGEQSGGNTSSQTNNIFRQSDRVAYAQDILRQIKPMPVSYASTITAINGMLFYASNTNATFTSTGLWLFENGAWKKL